MTIHQRPAKPAHVPDPYSSISPWVVTSDTGAFIDFAATVFGAVELGRVTDEHGVIGHAELMLGDTVILAFDKRPHWPELPALLRAYVADAQATFDRAIAAGAEPITRITPAPWGDVGGRFRDPLGNLWWIQQRVEDGVSEDEMGRRMGEPEWQERMAYVQSMDPFGH
jgi:uncharacterized glyoxalase superfamily protein PhnB